jgi:hypothetical protein
MGQGADECCSGEYSETNDVDAAIPENVAERGEWQQRDDDGKLVGVDDSDRICRADVNFLAIAANAIFAIALSSTDSAITMPRFIIVQYLRGSGRPSSGVFIGRRLCH